MLSRIYGASRRCARRPFRLQATLRCPRSSPNPPSPNGEGNAVRRQRSRSRSVPVAGQSNLTVPRLRGVWGVGISPPSNNTSRYGCYPNPTRLPRPSHSPNGQPSPPPGPETESETSARSAPPPSPKAPNPPRRPEPSDDPPARRHRSPAEQDLHRGTISRRHASPTPLPSSSNRLQHCRSDTSHEVFTFPNGEARNAVDERPPRGVPSSEVPPYRAGSTGPVDNAHRSAPSVFKQRLGALAPRRSNLPPTVLGARTAVLRQRSPISIGTVPNTFRASGGFGGSSPHQPRPPAAARSNPTNAVGRPK